MNYVWKRAVWYSSFSLVRQKCLVHQKFKLSLGLTQGVPSESDVTLVLLQSRTYSVRFSAWKVWRLNQALVTHCVHKEKYHVCTYQWFAPRIGSFFLSIVTKGILSLNFERKYSHKTSFTCIPKCMTMTM